MRDIDSMNPVLLTSSVTTFRGGSFRSSVVGPPGQEGVIIKEGEVGAAPEQDREAREATD
jgi:hypothetical protein